MAKTSPRPKAADLVENLDDDVWVADEAAGPSLVSRLSAEFVGTFLFMFVGLGVTLFGIVQSASTALAGTPDGPSFVGSFVNLNYAAPLTGALAWAIALIALIVAVGRLSGAHFNPAVTIGAWIGGRTPGRDVAPYLVVQVLGAVAAGAAVRFLASGFAIFTPDSALVTTAGLDAPSVGEGMSLIAIGADDHSATGAPLTQAVVVEFIATALLVAVILASTSIKAPKGQAPVTIGLSIGVLVLLAGPFSGGGLNPARVTATAIFATDADGAHWAIGDLWIWWVITVFAGAFVGLLFRGFGPLEDMETPAVEEEDGK